MGRKTLVSKGSITEGQLRDLYVTQSLSVKAIAEQLGIAQGSVYNYLKAFEIPTRSRGNRKSKATAITQPAPEVVLEIDLETTEESNGE